MLGDYYDPHPACHCGWAPDEGTPHRHVQRMFAGAVPDLVLVRCEDLKDDDAAWAASVCSTYLAQLYAIAVPWRVVSGAIIDRTLPPWRGYPFVTRRNP